ncbi:hypothetical protein TAESTU_20150 [Tenacibaculum aestuarii]
MLNKIKEIGKPSIKLNKSYFPLSFFKKNKNNKKIEEKTSHILKKITKKVSIEDIKTVGDKIGNFNKGPLKEVWNMVLQLWDVCKSEERNWKEKAMAIGALIYVITTIDAIPDAIPALGFLDDVGAVMAVFASLGLIEKQGINSNYDGFLKKKKINSEFIYSKIKVIVSGISLCANSDSDFSEIEKTTTNEIIEFFIFSDEGFASKQILEESKIEKHTLKDLINNYIEKPLEKSEIINLIELNDINKEEYYLFIFMVAFANNNINSNEREFLNKLSKSLDIKNQSEIENSVKNNI